MYRLHGLAQQGDTRLDAAVPLYGVYDFLDHSGLNFNESLRGFLNDKIMGCSAEQNPDLWQQASPVVRITKDAPPSFVIHGYNDVMASPEDASILVGTDRMANHVSAFLEWTYANRPATTES